ncbi:MAG: 1-phosphofructokinase [Lachnospiraceae bacterium]
MIVTVTMNPAMDKTADLEKLTLGGLNRLKQIESDAGGKGINVSKTIAALGADSIATGFLAGNSGKHIQSMLEELHISTDFLFIDGETRTNLKIVEQSGAVTEINEPGPSITPSDLQKLLAKLENYAAPDTLFVLAGSVPAGTDRNIYRQIIELVHEKGAKVLLDADGDLFTNALSAKPDFIKPNHLELAEFAGLKHEPSEDELLQIAKKLQADGISSIAVSMGKHGAMFLLDDYHVRCDAVDVKRHSTVGAGDAMVAAVSYSLDHGFSRADTVKMCMAVSAGAVTTIGTKPPTRELVDELLEKVKIETLN